jgi:hypothetical protein
VFLVLLLLAVQVTYHLYATSVVTAAAFDGARLAAGASSPGSEAAVRDHVVQLLGAYGRDHVEAVEVERDGDVVALRVVARNPGFLPSSLRRPMGLDRIDRTVRVRAEREVTP